MALRDDMMVVADREREPLVQTDIGSNGSPAKPRSRRRKSDESLSVGTIAVTMAAVITVGFAFAALLPSILTRGGVDSTPTLVAIPPPVAPPPIEQVGVTEPAGAVGPVQPPAPAPRAAASVDSKSAAQTAPALRTAIPSEKQAGGRVAATGRNDLTAAEKAAVSRGLSELKTTAAIAAPRRPAPTRPTLTEEEKAAIARGLRELEKTAGEAKP